MSSEAGRCAGLEVVPLLARAGGADQKTLSYDARMKSVSGQFRFAGSVGQITGTAILVDDVFTTGATLSECARVLLSNGFTRVLCASFAMEV